ncbi:MAG: amidohydrolase [Deltaproteobacteria bacterium]|nr:amidohydrolase [Deltaproteobacteria bacterium]
MAFDTLIHNATILTCSPTFDIIPGGWIGIAGDRILALGPGPGQAGRPAARLVIDARGGIVMPGLVNTHTHLPMTLLRGLADDLPLGVWLNEYIFPAERTVITPESVRWGTLLACAEMALAGTTTCGDGYFYEDAAAEAANDFGLRAVLGQGVIDFPAPGVSGAEQSLTAAGEFARRWLHRTNTIVPSVFCHSPYTCSADTLCRAKRLCDDLGLLFQIHVAETQGEFDHTRSIHGVSPIAYLERLGLLDERTLLVHCVRVDDEDIALIARRNAKVSHNPESNMKLAAGVAPVPQMLAAGITVGLGTDGCASNNDLDLFQTMDLTAKLHKLVRRDPTVLPAEAVIRMATIDGARALGLEREIGSLAPGKQADLILIDTRKPHLTPIYHPASAVVYAATGADVDTLMVAGRLLVQNRRLLTVDLNQILSHAEAIASPGTEPMRRKRVNPHATR